MMEDALFAQLLGMGFDAERISQCQQAMMTSDPGKTPSLQAATEWLLSNQHQASSHPPTLTLSPPSLVTHGPVSTSCDLSSPQAPLPSRHALSDEQSRDKERYIAKEREEALRKARERKMADLKAKDAVKRQIADDRRARQERAKGLGGPPSNQADDRGREEVGGATGKVGGATSVDVVRKELKQSDMCRVQVRLPDGKVVRHVFPVASTLQDVSAHVISCHPQYTSIQLVQTFPHHEFTSEELTQTLQALGLCPSASLVVRKQAGPVKPVSQEPVSQESQTEAVGGEFPKRPRKEENLPSDDEMDGQGSGGRGSGRGHRLGGAEDSPEPMDVGDAEQNRDQHDKPHSDSDSDKNNNYRIQPLPLPIGLPQGNIGLPPPGHPGGRRRVNFARGAPRLYGQDDSFGGSGNRLGGKETAMKFGDPQLQAERSAKAAAQRRLIPQAPPTSLKPRPLHSNIPSLESLCMRSLVSWSGHVGLPSCAGLTPMAAHRLLAALISNKKLNPKTLSAFRGCALQVLNLDNYAYATNELLAGLWYFPSLTQLSLGSCNLITDKAIACLFPYLSGLTHLNLNGCRQLNEDICRSGLQDCRGLEVLKLSQVKLTDAGMARLLRNTLPLLNELDLSGTLITVATLQRLVRGAPNLEVLALESTGLTDFAPLCEMPRLHTLNIAHCPAQCNVGSLSGCHGLRSLSLAGAAVDLIGLQQLAGLELQSLKLPHRNNFFDPCLQVVAGFPLTSLDLMDYCHISDVGIACVATMQTLTELSLSRTKLTDNGMPFLQGLTGLQQLSLDNTLVSDVGMMYIAGLTGLQFLSLSDTKVTSQFISAGVLDRLNQLARLNLSRTAVCDVGATALKRPSLIMLNLDWSCVTELCTLQYLQENGCPLLETLRVSNICQPLPGHSARQDSDDDGDM